MDKITSKNTTITGVGGREILLISHTLRKLVTGAGYDVKLSEVHGMAQRGDSVAALVRYGEKVAEPIVKEGQVGVLITFECLEVLQHLHFLKKGGVIIVNDWHISPTIVVTGVAEYPEGIVDRLKEACRTIVVETTGEVKKAGASRASNIIVLGVAAKHMGLEKKDWLKVIETTASPKTVEINRKASETGYTLSV